MLCTRMAWSCLGVLAMATWLATAHAQEQDNYHMVGKGASADNGEDLTDLRSEISELRTNMKSTVSGGYEQGPSCGCGAHCGCEGGCGADIGCGCDSCGCGGCCGQGGIWASAELMWFKYHRADGARVSNETSTNGDDDVPFDFEASPRFSLGFVREDGLGVRVRYWKFDHTAIKGAGTGDQDALSVNTYTLDGEVFDT